MKKNELSQEAALVSEGLRQMRTLNMQDMDDLLLGAGILGCGGGGDPKFGRQLIESIYDSGSKFTLADPTEIPDDAHLCIVGGDVQKEIREKSKPYLSVVERELTGYGELKKESVFSGQSILDMTSITFP